MPEVLKFFAGRRTPTSRRNEKDDDDAYRLSLIETATAEHSLSISTGIAFLGQA